MARTCWLIDRQRARSDDNVKPHCTCTEESPDFNVKLPDFMDFSPTDLPTTGMMMTTSLSKTPTDGTTTSPTPINATTVITEATSTVWPFRTVSTVTHHPQDAAENSASTLKDNRLMWVATTSSGAAVVLLILFTLFIFIICRSREKKRSSRDIDVIPVTNEEGCSLQGTPTPGVLNGQRAGPVGNNNPTLTESQDNGIDGSANTSSSNNAAITNTIVTLTDTSLKGDPV